MNYTENSFIKPPTVTGIISQETYDWAIRNVQYPFYLPVKPDLINHARWIIDRVHDGTLLLKPVKVNP